MAPKRPPLEESPLAPSSASQEAGENGEEEEEEGDSSSEESSEEEEDGEENKSTTPTPALDKKASSAKLVAPAPIKSTPQSSSEDEEGEEEDGSESVSESDSPRATNPMEETSKPKKDSKTKPGVSVTPPVKRSPVKPSNSKRQSEVELERKESKRGKKEADSSEEENKSTATTPPVDKKASSNKLVAPMPPLKSSPQSSSEDEDQEEDGSEYVSESDSLPATKPVKGTPKPKKACGTEPGVSVTPSPVKPSYSKRSKRSREIVLERKESKKAKKKEAEVEAEAKEEEDGKKKQMFQRIWSEEDEIAILKGMIDFSDMHGTVPYPNGDMIEFYGFVKNSLNGHFSRVQLTDKARRLKKKYSNNVARAKLGADPTFQKPHDQKAFALSKRIWGGEVNQKSNKAVNAEEFNGDVNEAALVKLENEPNTEPLRRHSFVVSDFTPMNESFGLSSCLDRAIEIGLGLLSEADKSELKEKRKELEDEEFQLYIKKLQLIQTEAKLAMQAYRAKHY